MYRIDNWINEGSGRIIESIDAEYINISVSSPLSPSSSTELLNELKNSMKGLIRIKNNDSNVSFGVTFCIDVFCYENGLTYPVYVSDQALENCMDLLSI